MSPKEIATRLREAADQIEAGEGEASVLFWVDWEGWYEVSADRISYDDARERYIGFTGTEWGLYVRLGET